MKKPNFFILGAPKCGTTSLSTWLSEHPNIFISPIKEPKFWCTDFRIGYIPSVQEYEYLFRRASDGYSAIGEASTSYLFSQVAVPRIEDAYPGARYIVMVRNPVEMVYSLHEQLVFGWQEHILDFERAWRLSPERRAGGMVALRCREPKMLDYQITSLLGEQLERLYTTVERDRVLVLILDDIGADPRREYLKVLEFLGVPDDGRSDFPVKNPAKERKWPGLHAGIQLVGRGSRAVKMRLGLPITRGTGILGTINRFNIRFRPRPVISSALKQELIDYFRPDIEKLGQLLSRDLSHWLEVKNS